MAKNRDLPKDVISHLIRPVPSKNIMNKLQTVVSALYLYDSKDRILGSISKFYKKPFDYFKNADDCCGFLFISI